MKVDIRFPFWPSPTPGGASRRALVYEGNVGIIVQVFVEAPSTCELTRPPRVCRRIFHVWVNVPSTCVSNHLPCKGPSSFFIVAEERNVEKLTTEAPGTQPCVAAV